MDKHNEDRNNAVSGIRKPAARGTSWMIEAMIFGPSQVNFFHDIQHSSAIASAARERRRVYQVNRLHIALLAVFEAIWTKPYLLVIAFAVVLLNNYNTSRSQAKKLIIGLLLIPTTDIVELFAKVNIFALKYINSVLKLLNRRYERASLLESRIQSLLNRSFNLQRYSTAHKFNDCLSRCEGRRNRLHYSPIK